ncbi:MAG TPA: valine--tRNA ligase [Rhodospirillaceae bacterium]|nr:MAG: valine--tRNA ligase [Alphaproteobacteria bacterium GWF2_58_20]HAU28889.1 valine--tRNA ligase [Rhodospirillaceae bacterium]
MLDKTLEPASMEAKHYDIWEKSGAFACNPASPKPPFCVMMPPPNVTGTLHIGHALDNSLQDILTRYMRMRGHDALWQPGTDHAGIATQMVVERQLAKEGIDRRDMGREAFIERVWKWKAESGGTIIRQLRRIGATADWDRERFTMDEGLSKAVRKVFVRLHKEGLIYKDKRLVNWDPKLHTAISDLEVVQKETKGHMWHLRYPIDGQEGRFIEVATTRPETMLGDTAIAVHPEDPRYADIIGKHAILPLVGRKIIIVGDLHADPETGTGAVKITPAHDFNDFEVAQRHDLPKINILDADARLNDEVPEAYRGLDCPTARTKILEDLEAGGYLVKVEDHILQMPYGDRSDVIIEPWLTDQWYVNTKVLAEPAIAAVERGETVFVPRSWENTYFNWMRGIQPWCISRQLWWGHSIPAWYGPDGTPFVEMTEEEAIIAAEKHYGEKVLLTPDPDVLDTWFSSALWPFSTLGWPDDTEALKKYYPTDVLVTGYDIIFFWVARMMMMGMHFMGEVPFKKVCIHALIRDEKGQKMSKSKGNTIDPLGLIDKFGADAVRFTMAALTAQGRDIKMSEGRVEGYRNFITKLWNSARYCEMNGCLPVSGFNPASAQLTVNQWIRSAVARCEMQVREALEAYRFNDATLGLYQFVWGTFCDWYLEFTKPILTGSDEAAKAETKAMTAWVLEQVLHMLHPFTPFVTEEIYEQLFAHGEKRLISGEWPRLAEDFIDKDAEDEMGWVVGLISEIRSLRSFMNVPAAAQIPAMLKDAGTEGAARLETHKDLVLRMARLESLAITLENAPKGAAQGMMGTSLIILPLAGIIDMDAEKARLAKEVEKQDAEIRKIDAKLGNPQFVDKAPEDVVIEVRERRAEAEAVCTKLRAALERMA